MPPSPPSAARALSGLSVSFTGKLAAMTRREAGALVRGEGGRVTGSVSRRTSMLVVGMDGWPVLPDGSVSRKLARAEALNEHGATIEIVAEQAFLERTGREARPPDLRKTYSAERVVSLLGITAAALRRWEALGLVRSAGGQFDFQDIVSLRTIADLLRRGVRPETVARTVRGLAAVLPGTERPLAQLKLVERDGALLAEIGDALVAADGQLLLDFAGDAPPDEALGRDASGARLSFAAAGGDEPESAETWLDRGVRHEEADDFDEAITAYRRALALQAHFPEAHYNLGNVLRMMERPEAAEEHFRLAIAQDPTLAEAWYNLADILEESGRPRDAITCLERAVRAEPAFADAHFNLALALEAVGDEEGARGHWRAYLRLDPHSAWAETARSRL